MVKNMNFYSYKKSIHIIIIFLIFIYPFNLLSVDNPDSTDHINKFLAMANKYQKNITNQNHNSYDYIKLYSEYEQFLDKELNTYYKILIKCIDKQSLDALKYSQLKWIDHRDAEFNFIESNFNKNNFGSSYIISRGEYRISFIKNRIITLIYYLRNYKEKNNQ
jgi:uncharacterized protein YecT (DUF1311 family)